jgi:hypothetical protein
MLVSFVRSDDAASADAAGGTPLASFRADNSTVFMRRGDVIALGDLTLPADATVNISDSQACPLCHWHMRTCMCIDWMLHNIHMAHCRLLKHNLCASCVLLPWLSIDAAAA